jgi:hypothetical protein
LHHRAVSITSFGHQRRAISRRTGGKQCDDASQMSWIARSNLQCIETTPRFAIQEHMSTAPWLLGKPLNDVLTISELLFAVLVKVLSTACKPTLIATTTTSLQHHLDQASD